MIRGLADSHPTPNIADLCKSRRSPFIMKSHKKTVSDSDQTESIDRKCWFATDADPRFGDLKATLLLIANKGPRLHHPPLTITPYSINNNKGLSLVMGCPITKNHDSEVWWILTIRGGPNLSHKRWVHSDSLGWAKSESLGGSNLRH